MKALLLVGFMFLGLNMQALEQCDPTSRNVVSFDDEAFKITQIFGDIAKQSWDNLDVTPSELKPDTGDPGYNATAKYSENLNCWYYQPRKYVNGVEVGPSNCSVYTCNVIERQ